MRFLRSAIALPFRPLNRWIDARIEEYLQGRGAVVHGHSVCTSPTEYAPGPNVEPVDIVELLRSTFDTEQTGARPAPRPSRRPFARLQR